MKNLCPVLSHRATNRPLSLSNRISVPRYQWCWGSWHLWVRHYTPAHTDEQTEAQWRRMKKSSGQREHPGGWHENNSHLSVPSHTYIHTHTRSHTQTHRPAGVSASCSRSSQTDRGLLPQMHGSLRCQLNHALWNPINEVFFFLSRTNNFSMFHFRKMSSIIL